MKFKYIYLEYSAIIEISKNQIKDFFSIQIVNNKHNYYIKIDEAQNIVNLNKESRYKQI